MFLLMKRNWHRNWNKAGTNPKWTNPHPPRLYYTPQRNIYCWLTPKLLTKKKLCSPHTFNVLCCFCGRRRKSRKSFFQFRHTQSELSLHVPLGFCFPPALSFSFDHFAMKKINKFSLWSLFLPFLVSCNNPQQETCASSSQSSVFLRLPQK